MSYEAVKLPPQQLPMSKKGKEWRKKHLDWASSKSFFNYSPVRNSIMHKKINYDLLNGKIHMQDIEAVINPEQVIEKFTPSDIQHYPLINSKINVLRGEEAKRLFDYKVVITNPYAISEKEEAKRDEVYQVLLQLVQDQSQSQEEYEKNIEKYADFFTYEWQDIREVRANELLRHYVKEYSMPLMFNEGFVDALTIGEEIYQCDIRGGEPIIERVNPLKIRVFKSGYSNKIEDADVVIMEDYWSPSKIIDTYYDVLSKKDIDYIENAPTQLGQAATNEVGERDERLGFVHTNMIDDTFESDGMYFDPFGSFDGVSNDLMPFDVNGNIRIIRMYWKSRRKIKKVKSFDPQTGDEIFEFYPESYKINKDLGQEEWIYYINEAWEGTKIGEEIYVNMRPRVIQYNRLSNPSRCHFGIVGTIYNTNDSKPYSLVDMMKPYNYLYDVIHDRLNKTMAKNWGRIISLDLAKVPKGWDIDKWLYYAKHNNIAVVDSFKEGNYGAATGKLAGAMNNASSGVIDAEMGNVIQSYINTLEFIKLEMSEVVGITKQREGQISSSETVGGVERSTLQSSYITEWWYTVHDDVKRRAMECFLETAKIALKGKSMKFNNILSDGSMQITTIEGDEFAEADYGLLIDATKESQELNSKLETIAQAAMQNQMVSFSTIMKLYSSISLSEKQKLIEKSEKEMMERQQQQAEQAQQMQQQQQEMLAQQEQAKMQQQDELNQRDNDTRIVVANINAQAEAQRFAMMNDDDGIADEEYSKEQKEKLLESIREFDKKLALDREKLAFEKSKSKEELSIKREALKKKSITKK